MYIYCHVIESQYVGDVMSQLLRVVTINSSKYRYASHLMVEVSKLHYVPIFLNEFDCLEIDLVAYYDSSLEC